MYFVVNLQDVDTEIFVHPRQKKNSSETMEKFISIHPDEEFCKKNSSG
jgi:hypothetical protein